MATQPSAPAPRVSVAATRRGTIRVKGLERAQPKDA